MEHQSFSRPEPIQKDVAEFYTLQREKIERKLAIDAVRVAGWYNYDGEEDD